MFIKCFLIFILQKENNVDENVYPEFYRKSENIKGSNNGTPQPFIIGIIENIDPPYKNNIKIKVRILYRPENTRRSATLSHNKDLNFLYYTDESKIFKRL